MLIVFVLSYKTGNVVNSGTWLAKLPPRAQRSQDSSLNFIFGAARLALTAGSQDTQSQGSVQAG